MKAQTVHSSQFLMVNSEESAKTKSVKGPVHICKDSFHYFVASQFVKTSN